MTLVIVILALCIGLVIGFGQKREYKEVADSIDNVNKNLQKYDEQQKQIIRLLQEIKKK